MRPLTLAKPKPLFEVGGRTMLDLALDKLVAAKIKRAVVNTFHLADQIEAHLKKRRDIEIIISREAELLDTGGGIRNTLPHFKGLPFIALNADLPWMDGATPGLERLKAAWNPETMDVLLLLMPTKKARGFTASGDFALEKDGRVWRKGLAPPRPYVLISAQIVKPELFASIPKRVFSNNEVWDKAEAHERLYGVVHDGSCHHVGTPEDLAAANELLVSSKGWLVDDAVPAR